MVSEMVGYVWCALRLACALRSVRIAEVLLRPHASQAIQHDELCAISVRDENVQVLRLLERVGLQLPLMMDRKEVGLLYLAANGRHAHCEELLLFRGFKSPAHTARTATSSACGASNASTCARRSTLQILPTNATPTPQFQPRH
jgi:hypothetical protein